MTSKVITLEFVVPTALAIILGILLSIGAVRLADNYLGPVIDRLIDNNPPAHVHIASAAPVG
jgi:hypothetical protein